MMPYLKKFLVVIAALSPVFFYTAYLCRYDDPFYWKVAGKENNYVIGLSRTRYGINPAVLDTRLRGITNGNFLNLGFGHMNTNYTHEFIKFVERKVNKNNYNNLFILSVNPASFNDLDYPGSTYSNPFYSKLYNVNYNPNIEYIIKNGNRVFQGFTAKIRNLYSKSKFVNHYHRNGWTETYLTDFSHKPVVVKRNIEIQLDEIREFAKTYHYFNELVRFLKQYGTVILVRIPASEVYLSLEEQYFPTFNKEMDSISSLNGLSYLNFERMQVETIDGSHMDGKSANLFSAALADSILNLFHVAN